MSSMEEKQKQAMALQAKIENIISQSSEEAVQALMNDNELYEFLKSYYMEESLNYDEEVHKRVEAALEVIEKEMANNPKSPYSPELLEAIVTHCKMGIMDEIVEKATEMNAILRSKLETLTITSPNCALHYQVIINEIFKFYMELMAKELKNEVKSRGLNEEEFMKQAFGIITGDLGLSFEIDSFVGLKQYEKIKDEPVTKQQVLDFSSQTIDYTKSLLEGKVNPQFIAIYPSLMNHFLFFKFKLDSVQVLGKVIEILKNEDKESNKEFFRSMLKEIYYVESGRAIIMMVFQQQLEIMDQMMKGGQMPGQMEGMGGMDPAMMEQMMSGMDPAMMQQMMSGMDPAMMQQMMSGIDPAMMQQMMQNADPRMIQEAMNQINPEMIKKTVESLNPEKMKEMITKIEGKEQIPLNLMSSNKSDKDSLTKTSNSPGFGMTNMPQSNSEMDEDTMKAMMLGMNLAQSLPKPNLNEEQKQKLQEAMMKGDLSTMMEMIPPEVKEVLSKLQGPGSQ